MSKLLIELDFADIEHIIKQSVDEHMDKYFVEITSRLEKLENKLEHYVEKYETVYNPIITVTSMIEQPEYTITCTEDYTERIENLEKRVFPFRDAKTRSPY